MIIKPRVSANSASENFPVKLKDQVVLARPSWIRAKAPDSAEVLRLTRMMREHQLHTVCESANCPNLSECFSRGTATFMIMGDICTRNCPFCNVSHGTPTTLSLEEPKQLAEVVFTLSLNYVVITSVTRDDLSDGGAGHFVCCIKQIRQKNPAVKVEILVPDFRQKVDSALAILGENLPDVFNHNLETARRLYTEARPGADYYGSLSLLQKFQSYYPDIPTKSGLMVGLGESDDEILETMNDLLDHGCQMLTIGQYLRPSRRHLPIQRYVTPEKFELYRVQGLKMGFTHVESGPLVRSSYHADIQAGPLLDG